MTRRWAPSRSAQVGLPILDGAKTSCDWANDPDAAVPGIFAPRHEPYLLRHDYVTNSNDSYWLANPHHPLAGFAQIIGGEGTPRTLRTRIGLIQVQARIDGTDGQGPPGFTLAAMRRLDLSDDSYAAQLTLAGLVKLCDKFQAAGRSAHGGSVRWRIGAAAHGRCRPRPTRSPWRRHRLCGQRRASRRGRA